MSQHKTSEYDRLMHSTKWLRLRKRKLTEHPLCEMCEKEGRIAPAEEIHHIHPIEDALFTWQQEALAYDYANLMALCHHCHAKVHKEMGRSGKEYTHNKNKQRLEQFKNKFIG